MGNRPFPPVRYNLIGVMSPGPLLPDPADWQCSAGTTSVVVLGLGIGIPALLGVWFGARFLRNALRARAEARALAKLAIGQSESEGPYRAASPAEVPTKSICDLERRARRYRNGALCTLVVFTLAHVTVFLRYHALRMAGRVETAMVFPTHRKPSLVLDYCPITVAAPGHAPFEANAWPNLFRSVEAGRTSTVPLMTAGPFHQLGAEAREARSTLVDFILFLIVYSFGCVLYVRFYVQGPSRVTT